MFISYDCEQYFNFKTQYNSVFSYLLFHYFDITSNEKKIIQIVYYNTNM